MRRVLPAVFFVVAALGTARAEEPEPVDLVDGIQGLLASARLDGWLLLDEGGRNSVAVRIVKPSGRPERAWMVFVPARGEPTVLTSEVDAPRLAHFAGHKVVYRTDEER